MVWQDVAISLANVLFTVSLVYQVYHGFRHKRASVSVFTSGLTVLGSYTIASALFTLNLGLSAAVTFVNGSLWLLLLSHGYLYK